MTAYGRSRVPGRIDPAAVELYSPHVLADSPLSYWPLIEPSGSAVDVVAGRNGTIAGSVTRPSASAPPDGCGADFAGSGQRIDIADAAEWDYSGDWSAEAWGRLTSLPGAGGVAFAREGSTGATQRWTVGVSSGGKPQAYVANGSTYKITVGPTNWPTNQWCHIVMTRASGGAVVLYFNGLQVATETGSVTSASTEQLTIGSNSANGSPWPGSIAHCAVYTSVLSAARVLAHYQAMAL